MSAVALKVVEPTDIDLVCDIGLHIRKLMSLPDWENIVVGCHLDEQPGVMCRLYLQSGHGIDVGVHMFENVAETFIGNHKATFASHCLGCGHYHIVWQVVPAARRYHVEFARGEDGQLTSRGCKQGVLRAMVQHRWRCKLLHQRRAFRTGRPTDVQSSVLTVYIVGKSVVADRRVLPHDRTFRSATWLVIIA